MSRTIKGSKGCGYDYWSKRPCSGNGHGKQVKKFTHRAERVIKKKETQEAIREMFEKEIEMKHWYYDKDTGTELWPVHFTFDQKKQFIEEVVGILPLEVGEDYYKTLRYSVDNVQHLLYELKEQGISPKDVHLYVDHIDEGWGESDGAYSHVIRASYHTLAIEQDVIDWVVTEFNNNFCSLKKEYEQAMDWAEDHGFALVPK